MTPLNDRVKPLLIAALLLLGFGAFLALATDFGSNLDNNQSSDNVAALNTTSSQVTFRSTSTTSTTIAPTTTTSVETTLPVAPTTTAKATTATTAKKTTATTAKKTSTSTTVGPPHTGTGRETSDNAGAFTHNADDTYTGSSVGACVAADPFCFNLGAGTSTPGHPHEVQLIAVVRNHTSKPVTFPGGLKLMVTVHNPGGTTSELAMDASAVTSIAPGEAVTISSWTSFVPPGSFSFDATCEVDYGS